jgi:hypothetical protein
MERVHHGLLKGTMSKREASSPEYYYTHLDDELPDVKEEVSDAIIMLVLVKDEEFEVWKSWQSAEIPSLTVPGAMKADVVHSLMRSTARRYLEGKRYMSLSLPKGSYTAATYMAPLTNCLSSTTSNELCAIICKTSLSLYLPNPSPLPSPVVVEAALPAYEFRVKPPASAPNAVPKPKTPPPPEVEPLRVPCELWVLSRLPRWSYIDELEGFALEVVGEVALELVELKNDDGPLDVMGLEARSAWYIGLSRVPTMQK